MNGLPAQAPLGMQQPFNNFGFVQNQNNSQLNRPSGYDTQKAYKNNPIAVDHSSSTEEAAKSATKKDTQNSTSDLTFSNLTPVFDFAVYKSAIADFLSKQERKHEWRC